MHKVFISYHHKNDQNYKKYLSEMGETFDIFVDRSVQTGDIYESLGPQVIRRKIRDERLRDSTVTILLCGTETRFRKHVDWELKSSMIDGQINKKSGILVVMLPSISNDGWFASYFGEKEQIYPDYTGDWVDLQTKAAFKDQYPNLPERIIDNMANVDAKISVVPWSKIVDQPANLSWLIHRTFESRITNEYDLSLPMRMRDHNPYSYA